MPQSLQTEVNHTLERLPNGSIQSSSHNNNNMYSLEMEDAEEEEESLIRETTQDTAILARNTHFRHRVPVLSKLYSRRDYSQHRPTVFGTLRSHLTNSSTIRSITGLILLGLFCFFLVDVLDWDLMRAQTHVSDVTVKTTHGPSLGGHRNPGHYDTSWDDNNYDFDNDDPYLDDDEWQWASHTPDSSSQEKNRPVRSISKLNLQNDPGHYLHDPLKSPWASPYYASTANNDTLRAQLQMDFLKTVAEYEELYGKWETIVAPHDVVLPHYENTTLNRVPYQDWNNDHFSDSAWLKDSEYMEQFLEQATALVKRVKSAIVNEYGVSTDAAQEEFKVILGDDMYHVKDGVAMDNQQNERIPGIAFLNQSGWEALIRKLLHAMVTSDAFFVVLAGDKHSYQGNNLFQSQVMQFNHVMEPVFDKLGVTLISRHFGMDASTAVTSLGGASLYGEADIMWYVADEESAGEADLFHKQAILSGERVPILLSPRPDPLWTDTNDAVWMGNIQPGATFCPPTLHQDGKVVVPKVPACKYVNCKADPKYCAKKDSVCWIQREDVELFDRQEQDDTVGNQGPENPGYLTHRLEGRKLAMLVLHALEEALYLWSHQETLPLPEELWHVGDAYETVREAVRTVGTGECGKLLRHADERLCQLELHALTEWTPRVTPEESSLRSIATEPIPDNHQYMRETYRQQFDLMPPQWQPKGVDAHLVAILAETEHLKDDTVPEAHPNGNKGGDDDDFMTDDNYVDPNYFDDYYGDDFYLRTRRLMTSDVASNRWTLYNRPIGFCDGSAQSKCNRIISNTCLLSHYNHYRSGVVGHGQSGKLSFMIPNVQSGLIMARFDWEMEDGPRLDNLPKDFSIDITVHGDTSSYNGRDFSDRAIEIVQGLTLHVLLKDQSFVGPKDVQVDIQVQSKAAESKTLLVYLSHLYYA